MPKLLGKLTTIDEAVRKASETIRINLNVEEAPVQECLGRIIHGDFKARLDQPRFDRAAVDGYAVRSIDVVGASPFNPVTLRVKGLLLPGDTPEGRRIGPGEAYEVHTGAPLPEGADAVVMYEDTRGGEGIVEVYRPVPAYGNVSRRGEDYTVGRILVKDKTILKPWHIAAITGNGVSRINVYEKLNVGLVVTGSEVVEPGLPLKAGSLYNSTGYLVKTYIESMGFTRVNYYGVYPDVKEAIREAVFKAADENHIVVTTGGTSVSSGDLVRDIVEEDGEWIVRGVAMRPGRPTSIALLKGKPLFLLSGYPVAAWTGLEALFKPIIYRVLNVEPLPVPSIKARLKVKVPNAVGYRSYIRVKVWRENGEYVTQPFMLKGSGILSSLLDSNGYMVIPENVEGYEEGDEVTVYLI
jgi:molybdopterin molybdotransferase